MNSYFITGIDTNVGKTIASSIITEALEADYWKPIQAGDLQNSDTQCVEKLISNKKTVFHPSGFMLKNPMSPHAAAKLDGIELTSSKLERPGTSNHLVIEGAGGLLVPLNNKETILDLIKKDDKIILISKHYLGSINHTLLSLEALKSRNLKCFGIIFNGEKNTASEEVILEMSKVPFLGRINLEPYFDKNVIKEYADELRENLI